MKKALMLAAMVGLIALGTLAVVRAQEGGGEEVAPPTPATSAAPSAPMKVITLPPDKQQKLAAELKAVEDAVNALKDKACIEVGDKDGKAYVAQTLIKLAQVINPPPAVTTPPAIKTPLKAPVKPAAPAKPPARGGPKGGGEG